MNEQERLELEIALRDQFSAPMGALEQRTAAYNEQLKIAQANLQELKQKLTDYAQSIAKTDESQLNLGNNAVKVMQLMAQSVSALSPGVLETGKAYDELFDKIAKVNEISRTAVNILYGSLGRGINIDVGEFQHQKDAIRELEQLGFAFDRVTENGHQWLRLSGDAGPAMAQFISSLQGVSRAASDVSAAISLLKEEQRKLNEAQAAANLTPTGIAGAGRGVGTPAAAGAESQQQLAAAAEEANQILLRQGNLFELSQQVAKEYGLNASQAMSLITQEAQRAGVTQQELAQQILFERDAEKQAIESVRQQELESLARRQSAYQLLIEYGEQYVNTIAKMAEAQVGVGPSVQPTLSTVAAVPEELARQLLAIRETTEAQEQLNTAFQKLVPILAELGASETEAVQVLQRIGASAKQAKEAVTEYAKAAQESMLGSEVLGPQPASTPSEKAMTALAQIREQHQKLAEIVAQAIPQLKAENATMAEATEVLMRLGVSYDQAVKSIRQYKEEQEKAARAAQIAAQEAAEAAEKQKQQALMAQKGDLGRQIQEDQAAGATYGQVSDKLEAYGLSIRNVAALMDEFWVKQNKVNEAVAAGTQEAQKVEPILQQVARAYREEGSSLDNLIDALKSLGASEKDILEVLTQEERQILANAAGITQYEQRILAWQRAGLSTAQAVEKINAQDAAGIPIKEQLTEAAKRREEIIRQETNGTLTLAEATRKLNAASVEEAETASRANASRYESMRSAREAGLTFFGLTIASFGLMEIQKQLKDSTGQSNEVLDKSIGLMRTVSSMGSAGAFLGGAPGALIGATVGLLMDLPELLDRTSNATQELVKQMGDLAAKSDAANTLRQIGNISGETARQLVQLAQSTSDYSQRFAHDLETVAKAQKDLENAKLPGIVEIMGLGTARAFGGPAGESLIADKIQEDNRLLQTNAQAHMDVAKAALQHSIALLPLIQQQEALNTEVENLGKSSSTLGKLIQDVTKVTQEDASAARDAAQAHPEWNQGLIENAKNIALLQLALRDAGDVEIDYGGKVVTVTQALKDQTEQFLVNVQAALAQQKVLEEFAPLLSMLKGLGTPTPEEQLSGLTGQGGDVIDRFKLFAQSHREVAQEASALVQQIEQESVQLEDLKARGEGASEAAQQLRNSIAAQKAQLGELIQTHQDYSKELDKAAQAEERYAKALEDANKKRQEAIDRAAQQSSQARQTYANTIADAERTRLQAEAQARLQQQDREADIQQQLADRITDIWTNYAQKVSDIQVSLANKIADIQQQLQDKLQSLAHDYQQKLNDIQQQRVQAEQSTADKLYQIERDRIESLEKLGFDTHEQLMAARTQHDRDTILRRAQFEAGQINQRANDQATDAEKELARQEQRFKKEQQLALQTYEYERKLAIQKAEEDRARAERDAAQQMAVALREAIQAQQLAERTANEQIAQSQRTMQEQIANAAQVEQNKRDDAARTLSQRLQQIEAEKQAQLKAIEETRQAAYNAYVQELGQIGNLITLWNAYLMQFGAAGRILETLGGKDLQNWMKGFQNIVPIPQGGSGWPFGGIGAPPPTKAPQSPSVNININGANSSPTEIANKVRDVLSREMFNYGAAYG